MFKTSFSKDNAVAATYLFLKSIGAKVTEKTVEETLHNHPDYPSLLATSDALNEWNIENVAVRIKSEQLAEIPTPFLTHLNMESGIFALVKSVKTDDIEWVHTKEGFKREKTQDFFRKWNGVVLMAETNEHSGEKKYTENRKKEFIENIRIVTLWIGSLMFALGIYIYNFTTDWNYNALLSTKFAGIIISSLLLWQSIDKNNPFINSLCQTGDKVNCNTILSSNVAKVTSWLSWAEIGFFYFAGGFIALLMNPSSIFLLWGIGVTSLLYTFWSLHYQAFVAKQWCILCLTIQLLFIIEFLLNIHFLSELKLNFLNLTLKDVAVFVFGLTMTVWAWLFLKPLLQKKQQAVFLEKDLKRFKNNPDLFLSFLQKQTEMPFIPMNMSTIILGNPNAEHTLTMVTNPFCQPCARTHKIIEDLLFSNENLNCQIIFSASNSPSDRRGLVARIILSLPKNQQAEALHQWFKNEERNIAKWQTQLGVIEDKKAEIIIDQHRVWCEMANIEGTPTIYLDSFKLPELYRIEDLERTLKYLPTLDLAKS